MIPQMEHISDETKEKLKAISSRISELREQIEELNKEAYELVPKHTFEECKEMGCQHTYRNRYDCHCYCVRRKNYTGCFQDYYLPKPTVVKLKTSYPMLGWKSVVPERGSFVYPVIKETDKTLILKNKTQLLKSTMRTVEDCVFLESRTGTTYLCADDPDTIEMQKTLLQVLRREWCEAARGMLSPKIPEKDIFQ